MLSIKEGKMPNVTIFLVLTGAFLLLGWNIFGKHLDFDDLDDSTVIFMNLGIVFGMMAVPAIIYNVDFLKKREPKKQGKNKA